MIEARTMRAGQRRAQSVSKSASSAAGTCSGGADSGTAVLTATAVVFYCPAVDETFCLIRDVNFIAPIEIDPAGGSSIRLTHQLLAAEELEQRLGTG